MKQDLAKYIKKNLPVILGGIALRQMSISSRISKYSYYDMEEALEYFSGNSLADTPNVFTSIFYRVLSLILSRDAILTAVYLITMIGDFFCGYFLNNISYFLATSLLPVDLVSTVCVLFSLYHRKYFRQVLLPLILIISVESTHTRCDPGINPYWYINMQMFSEYKILFQEIFRITHYFLLFLSLLSNQASTKLYLAMVFKDFGYRGYILVWCMLRESMKNKKIFNLCRGIAIVGGVLDTIIWYMLVFEGVGNMNFLCWSNIITILSTGGATVLNEYTIRTSHKSGKQTSRIKKE